MKTALTTLVVLVLAQQAATLDLATMKKGDTGKLPSGKDIEYLVFNLPPGEKQAGIVRVQYNDGKTRVKRPWFLIEDADLAKAAKNGARVPLPDVIWRVDRMMSLKMKGKMAYPVLVKVPDKK